MMQKAKIVGSLVTALVVISIFALVGRWDWPRGWAFIGLLLLGRLIAAPYLWRKNPELMQRRGQIGVGTKTWDLIVLTLFGVTFLAIPTVAALDIRYDWSGMSVWLWPAGAALYAFFVAVFTGSMAVNPFFEKTVRIQGDRDHRVIESGPYGIVRHPGYIAIVLGLVLAMPLLLGSWWAFVPAMLCTLSLILRTALEDRTLQKELSGYKAYSQKVRYRLIPGLW